MAELKYTSKGSLLADATLKAYYRMESGALTTDSSGNGKTLTNNNSVAEIAGNFGGAADFGTANSSKSLVIADQFGINAGAARSYSFWVKMRTEIASGSQTLMWTANSEARLNYYVDYEYNGGTRRLNFRRYKPNVGEQNVQKNITMGTSVWHHIVLTYDGSTMKAYVDNAAPVSVAASGVGTNSEAAALHIGMSEGSIWASCAIDDFAVFSKELSAAEVSALYNDLTADTNTLTNYRGRKRTPSPVSI